MKDHPTLFDRAHARRTDPETSHQAADSVLHLTDRRKAVLECLRLCGAMTDEQIEWNYRFRQITYAWPQQSVSGLRTRRSELVRMGLVEDSGKRVRLSTGRMAIVWRAT